MQPKADTNGKSNGFCHVDPVAVREQLDRILASASFRNSKRHSAFLRYVVEETLNGNADHLKERGVGAQVFGLDPAYDTSANPVVRVSAGELRKRVAQYYHDPGREVELRITLPAGSYVPEFHLPEPAPVAELPPAPARRRLRLIYLIVPAAALLLTAALWVKPWSRAGAFDRFWQPVWDASGPVLISVAGRPGTDETGRRLPERLALTDSIALANLTPVLKGHGKNFRVLTHSATTLDDLKRGPVIHIGAFSNVLTLRLMREARFTFEMDPDTRLAWIKDRQNPGDKQWLVNRNAADPSGAFTDYAMVARVVDPSTDNIALVAAGISGQGTRAAGEFLSNPRAMDAIARDVAGGWQGNNVQIIITLQVTQSTSGTPKVLATYSW